eukprot:7095032-Alexandrium_andersonii.AAC.1
MGRLPQSEFRSKWEAVIDDVEAAGVDADIHPKVLRRKYLAKLTDELRDKVLVKDHTLDGPGQPRRRPSTWEEVAEAVELILEARADTKAPGEDSLRAIDPGHTSVIPTGALARVCRYCQRPGRTTELCPKKAAGTRGDTSKCLADSERAGK